MPRLFVALTLPEAITDHLLLVQGGIPGAKWEAKDKLHLTLRFIGEVDGGTARDIVEALARIEVEPFELALSGVGHFPPRGAPRSVWAGVDDPDPVADLHARIERALSTVGLEPERRKFAPHVTLARLKHSPEKKVVEFLQNHALFHSASFVVSSFCLMSSVLNPGGSRYRVEHVFDLG
jgi:2'-5' RNA ligase